MLNKIDGKLIKAQIVAENFKEKLSAKKSGDENLIVKIILMVVAVVLCILFRNVISDVMKNLLDGVKTNINGIYGSATGNTTP